VVGFAYSHDYPTTPGVYDPTLNGYYDVVVSKLAAHGDSLIWSTYIGGANDNDLGRDICLDSSENPVITGYTESDDFPTTPGAFDETFNATGDAWEDGFVAKLSANGDSLFFSTYLGGQNNDHSYAITLDTSGNPLVCGKTASDNFPTTPGAYDQTYGPYGFNCFVTKLDATGSSLVFSTYLGGGSNNCAYDIVLDGSENPVVVGTGGGGFPTTPGSFDPSFNGVRDAFICKLDTTCSSLLWSGFLGGDNGDEAHAVVLDASENVIVCGWAGEPTTGWPTTSGAYDETHNGGQQDVFVTKIGASGSGMMWSTLLGHEERERATDLCLDDLGNVIITGCTNSDTFPTTPDAFDETTNNIVAYDGILCKI
jgi:hypothetical protein